MSESKFHVSVITSDGAALIARAKDSIDESVYLYKAVYIPQSFNRSNAANLHFADFKEAFGCYIPENNNISAVLVTNSNAEKAGNVFVQCADSGSGYIVKSVVILGCLYTERESPKPVVFAVLSDDNACFLCGEKPLELSLVLPVSNDYIHSFGENTLTGIDLSGYATKSDLSAKQETTVMDMDGSYSIIDGGFYHEITNSISQANYSVRKQNVPVSVDLVDNKLVLITQNGDKYTVTATVDKANVFDPVILTGYTNHNNPGQNTSVNGNSGSTPEQGVILNTQAGEYIEYDDSKTYTVKKVYAADNTEVAGQFVLYKNSQNYLCLAILNYGTGFIAAYCEYTAE